MPKEYLEKLKNVLEEDDFLKLDEVLELSVTWILTQEEILEIDEILNEATLYAEFKESDYKEEALRLIDLIL